MTEKRRGSRRRLAALGFGAVLAVLFAAMALGEGIGHPGVPAETVAMIEGVPGGAGTITDQEFRRAVEQAATEAGLKRVPGPGTREYASLGEKALNALLEVAWIPGEAKAMGITATGREVDEALGKLVESFKSRAAYEEFVAKSHYTPADMRERVEVQVLEPKVRKQIEEAGSKPSEEEIAAYYEETKAVYFTHPAMRDIRLIFNLKRGRVEEAMARLASNDSAASWAKVARKYSQDQGTRLRGGLQKNYQEGVLGEVLSNAVFKAPRGRLEGVVAAPRGYYAFEVESITPKRVESLEQGKGQAESRLRSRELGEIFSTFLSDNFAEWRSRTFCDPRYATERCANFQLPAHPAKAPAACYEANPKGRRPAACPAPVTERTAALPGSVTTLWYIGKQLPQRPRPAGLKPAE